MFYGLLETKSPFLPLGSAATKKRGWIVRVVLVRWWRGFPPDKRKIQFGSLRCFRHRFWAFQKSAPRDF